jgi:hypothetical protein
MHMPDLKSTRHERFCPLRIPLLDCFALALLPCPQAEAQVLYPILQRLGENGGLWAKRALAVSWSMGHCRSCAAAAPAAALVEVHLKPPLAVSRGL